MSSASTNDNAIETLHNNEEKSSDLAKIYNFESIENVLSRFNQYLIYDQEAGRVVVFDKLNELISKMKGLVTRSKKDNKIINIFWNDDKSIVLGVDEEYRFTCIFKRLDEALKCYDQFQKIIFGKDYLWN
jgi:hypothetical protein